MKQRQTCPPCWLLFFSISAANTVSSGAHKALQARQLLPAARQRDVSYNVSSALLFATTILLPHKELTLHGLTAFLMLQTSLLRISSLATTPKPCRSATIPQRSARPTGRFGIHLVSVAKVPESLPVLRHSADKRRKV